MACRGRRLITLSSTEARKADPREMRRLLSPPTGMTLVRAACTQVVVPSDWLPGPVACNSLVARRFHCDLLQSPSPSCEQKTLNPKIPLIFASSPITAGFEMTCEGVNKRGSLPKRKVPTSWGPSNRARASPDCVKFYSSLRE